MIQVVVLGTGNVASHFIKAFQQSKKVELVQIYNHNAESLKEFKTVESTTQLQDLKVADVYLICVKDDVVERLAQNIKPSNVIIAHTSGSLPLLQSQNRDAVFYPLQTFSKAKTISFKDLPICIETENESDVSVLKTLAQNIEAKVYEVNSTQRQELHLAAVFVCNFVNHLYHIGHEICSERDLPFDILKPLIKETADKINYKIPSEAQTGPAKRNDNSTIKRHLKQIDSAEYKELYRYLTTSIQNTYER